VQLIFDRRFSRRTPGKFRTRVITEGVPPSLHVDYKNTRIKQYHKEGRALRTETTINNTRDFGIRRSLHNLPALRQVGFQANRRLLDVQQISHDCSIGEDAFDRVGTNSRRRACASRSSSPEPTRAYCVPNWRRSCHRPRQPHPLCEQHLIASIAKLTHAVRINA